MFSQFVNKTCAHHFNLIFIFLKNDVKQKILQCPAVRHYSGFLFNSPLKQEWKFYGVHGPPFRHREYLLNRCAYVRPLLKGRHCIVLHAHYFANAVAIAKLCFNYTNSVGLHIQLDLIYFIFVSGYKCVLTVFNSLEKKVTPILHTKNFAKLIHNIGLQWCWKDNCILYSSS